jgi:hypothetical protein
MKKILKTILFLSLLVPLTSPATETKKEKSNDSTMGSDLPLREGSMISLKSFDKKTKTFSVFAVQFPGEGFSDVTPEALARSVAALKIKAMIAKPETYLGNQYQLDQPLPTLSEAEKLARLSSVKN